MRNNSSLAKRYLLLSFTHVSLQCVRVFLKLLLMGLYLIFALNTSKQETCGLPVQERYQHRVCEVISFAMSSDMTWVQSDGSLSNGKQNAIAKLKAQRLSPRVK